MTDTDLSPAQMQKSNAILDAANEHFAANGFEATKLSDVAKDAGVAVGTIYLRYNGKAELLAGVLDRTEAAFCAAMDTPVVWATPFPQRFTLVVSAMLSTAQKEANLAKLMALVSYASQPSSPDKSRILLKIEEHIQDGMDRGELRADVDPILTSRMAHGMVDGAMRELMTNPKRDAKETTRHIAEAYARWLMKA